MHLRTSDAWVVDEDPGARTYMSELLALRGFQVLSLSSGQEALDRFTSSPSPSLLLLDIKMPEVSGLEVLAQLQLMGRRVPTIVTSGLSQVPTVVQAMRLGALDYLLKPVDEKALAVAVDRVLPPNSENHKPNLSAMEIAFQTSNPRMLRIRTICDKAAQTEVPILILGESGVGKEVVARYIHDRSLRSEPFLKVNCAALPTDLLESELFGHERGAFTGALRDKPGKFELAARGTIMLDEVAEMSLMLQAKLLHVLQDGEFSRLGGVRTLTAEARVIAATNKALLAAVANGTFREDLYFRLNVVSVEIPPLRERHEDIPLLCDRFVQRYRSRYNSRIRYLPQELVKAFENYHWPGNIRQLENAVKRFLILLDVEQAISELEVSPTVLPKESNAIGSGSLKGLAASAAEQAEKEVIFRTLNEVNWNRKQAARNLKICYKSLLNKLHRWQRETDSNGKPIAG